MRAPASPLPARFRALQLTLPALLALSACGQEPGAMDGAWRGGSLHTDLAFDTDDASCDGDAGQYDANAFAASLAAATANELGRWEVVSDFALRAGKLELSATGELHCGMGCANIRALLRLQDDASGVVPGHDPERFRTQLASWYQLQKAQLTELVDAQLSLDKGIYRLRNRQTGKYLQIDSGSMEDGAPAEQHTAPSQPGAEQWRVWLDHGSHQLINVRSGKCLALSDDSSADNAGIAQQTCSLSNPLQRFGIATVDQFYSIRTKTGLSLRVKDAALTDDAPIVQFTWTSTNWSELWTLERVPDPPPPPPPPGTPPPPPAAPVPPDALADAMYTLVAQHSNKAITYASAVPAEGALIEQREYLVSDDGFHWYLQRVNEKKYRLVNRRSGKCLDLQAASSSGRLVQRTCSDADTQLFMIVEAGDGSNVLYSLYGRSIEVEGASLSDDAVLAQGNDTSWSSNRQFLLTPLLASEPRRVSFSHASADGACGDNLWFDIAAVDGAPLAAPEFAQLIFAGGKTSAAGQSENPFLTQPSSGNSVALDPAGSMLAGAVSLGSACVASALLFDATGAAEGHCCLDDRGAQGALHVSSWSPTTFLCQ